MVLSLSVENVLLVNMFGKLLLSESAGPWVFDTMLFEMLWWPWVLMTIVAIPAFANEWMLLLVMELLLLVP